MNTNDKPNVILLLIDGARIDRLKESKDFIDCISLGSTFTDMFSYAPYTLASMCATFSGMYGTRNGVDAYSKMFQYNDKVKFFADVDQSNCELRGSTTQNLTCVSFMKIGAT